MNRKALIAVLVIAIALTVYGLYRSGKLDSIIGDSGPGPLYSQSGEVTAHVEQQITYRYATFITVDGVQSSTYKQRTISIAGGVPLFKLTPRGEGFTETRAQSFDITEGTRIVAYFDSQDENEMVPVKVHILP